MKVAVGYKGTFNHPLWLVKNTFENHRSMLYDCFDDIDFFFSTYEGESETEEFYRSQLEIRSYSYIDDSHRNSSTWNAQLEHHQSLARQILQQDKTYDLVIITRPDLRWLKRFDEVNIDKKTFNIPIRHDSGNCDDNLFVFPSQYLNEFIDAALILQRTGGITHAINHRLEERNVPIHYMQDYDDSTFIHNSNLGQSIFTMCKYLKSEQLLELSKNLTSPIKEVSKPWGSYLNLVDEDYTKVKKIVIRPGESPSYQYHYQRREVWVIIQGTLTVRLNDIYKTYGVGDAIQIPRLSKHQPINNGDVDAVFIEVQLGTYFGEDDIVRLEDKYGRI